MKSRDLEEIKIVTNGNEENSEVMVRIPHPKINI